MNKISNRRKRKLRALFDLYPAIDANLPLRIGAINDCKLPILPQCKRWLFTSHTRRRSYLLKMMEEGSQRHDLQGNVVEPVLDEHREFAKTKLAEVDAYYIELSKQPKPEPPKPKPKKKPKPKAPEKKRFALSDDKPKKAPTIIVKKRRKVVIPTEKK